MLRFLADENLNGDLVDGLRIRQPDLDLVRVQDIGLSSANDSQVLEASAVGDRILLTHDYRTIPPHAYRRIAAGDPMTGVFIVPQTLSFAELIEELLLLANYTEPEEWINRVVYLPIRP